LAHLETLYHVELVSNLLITPEIERPPREGMGLELSFVGLSLQEIYNLFNPLGMAP
jgi:hypothetical protein